MKAPLLRRRHDRHTPAASSGGRRGYLALKGPWRVALLLACLSPSPKPVISLKPSHSTKEVLFISRGWFEMSGPVSQRIHATANIFSHHFPIFKFKTQSISPIRKYILYMLNYARYSRYMKQYKMVLTIRELYSAKNILHSTFCVPDLLCEHATRLLYI